MSFSQIFHKTIVLVLFYSIAMGFMESAVVIYLRHLYYPEGFRFPLVPISKIDSLVELSREAATLIMLVTVACLADENRIRRFGYFLLAFAVWDLTYYIFLKIALDWPASILDWDILFLIPVPWFAPVLAPCLIAVLMMVFSFILILPSHRATYGCIRHQNWFWLITGSITIIISFVYEYVNYVVFILKKNPSGFESGNLLEDLIKFIPVNFNWPLFIGGFLILISQVFIINNQIRKKLTFKNYAFE